MSGYRAQANHRLYLARLLLQAWEEGLAQQRVPAWTLAQAFEPAVCDHLADAYGWFLLEIAQPEPAPPEPPRCCADLPEPPAGKMPAPELREFEQLEQSGWLREVLRSRRGAAERQRRADNLAGDAPAGPEEPSQWVERLQRLFDRMSDSLDEY